MDWATNNMIADLHGPGFLLFYACVIVVTLVVCRWQSQQPMNPGGRPPQIPSNPDPYEIAYLRGGPAEVVRLAVFMLMERGYLLPVNSLKAGMNQTVKQADPLPDINALTPLERQV